MFFSVLEQFTVLPVLNNCHCNFAPVAPWVILISIFIGGYIFFLSLLSLSSKKDSLAIIPNNWQGLLELVHQLILSIVKDNRRKNLLSLFLYFKELIETIPIQLLNYIFLFLLFLFIWSLFYPLECAKMKFSIANFLRKNKIGKLFALFLVFNLLMKLLFPIFGWKVVVISFLFYLLILQKIIK